MRRMPLIQSSEKKKAAAVPIGVDTDYFKYEPHNTTENIIGFLGAMNVAHNENAARHFINDILPLIVKQVPDAKFLVIGGGVSEDLKKLSDEHIIFSGRVDDVRDYLKKCRVFVCPMTFGSGIKTKNLEAMAMGLPVVTTSIGAENIDAKNQHDWCVADNEQEFADAVCNLLADENKRNEMAENASRFVCDHFTWKIAKRKFEMIFEEIK